jgi:cell division protein FtsN
MARAYYYRGVAYRQQGKPAMAIADLTSALWLKGGLSDQDRKAALDQRAQAYREAGLSDQSGDPAASRSASATPSSPTAAAGTKAGGQDGRVASAEPASPGLTDIISNLFGQGSSAATPKPQPVAPATTAALPKAAAPPAAASSWSTDTTAARAASGNRQAAAAPPASAPTAAWTTSEVPTKAAARPPVTAAPAAPVAGGRYGLQVGAANSRGEAEAIAQRLQLSSSGLLNGRRADVVEVNAGNFGIIYRVRLAPFQNVVESKTACNQLRAKGFDCLIVTQ